MRIGNGFMNSSISMGILRQLVTKSPMVAMRARFETYEASFLVLLHSEIELGGAW